MPVFDHVYDYLGSMIIIWNYFITPATLIGVIEITYHEIKHESPGQIMQSAMA